MTGLFSFAAAGHLRPAAIWLNDRNPFAGNADITDQQAQPLPRFKGVGPLSLDRLGRRRNGNRLRRQRGFYFGRRWVDRRLGQNTFDRWGLFDYFFWLRR